MRVSPTWAIRRVEGEAGFQKGVAVGVEMSAVDAVDPPLNRVAPPIGALRSGEDDGRCRVRKFCEAGRSG
jgi:hypothetical protein